MKRTFLGDTQEVLALHIHCSGVGYTELQVISPNDSVEFI